jgi:apolipoprotein D and lipocalin family protein
LRWAALLPLLVLLGGCLGVPDGVRTVTGFELDRYLGQWYEIARLDHRFERGLSEVTATYSLRDDGSVKVVNRGYDAGEQRWKDAEGRAVFVGEPDEGRLKVSFFGPFYGAYNIMALDHEDYRWAMVCGPDLDYLWILSREPELPPGVLERLLEQARSAGFDTDALIVVDHGVSR